MWPFHGFVLAHIATGAVGLITFWVVVLSQKGGSTHRKWGRVFASMMLMTGSIAIAISTCTLLDPAGTHPHIPDVVLVEGIFGWMMLYLAILTINLAWHGWLSVSNRREHDKNLAWHNLALQAVLFVAASKCAYEGWQIGQPMMIGISLVGFATVATNLFFLWKPERRPYDAVNEHIKALVGAGISVYTAFFAFGAVRIMPEIALNPILWSVPLITGLGLILYHQRATVKKYAGRRVRAEAAE